MINTFGYVYCGALLNDGCGQKIDKVIRAYYRGITFRGGFMVYMFQATKPFDCPYCGRRAEYIYCRCENDSKIEIEGNIKQLQESMK